MPPISLCMILCNEELTIERTIESARPIISEIVIGLDRCSSDGTRGIIERSGAWIIETHLSEELAAKKSLDARADWGFSKARNDVLAACDPIAWRLILDGHEILKAADLLAIATYRAMEAESDCVDVRIFFEPDANGIPQTIYESTRVLAPHVRYTNPQHNVPVVCKRYTAHDVIIEHRKRDQAPSSRAQRDAQRSDSNIAGFEMRVKDEPKNARAWFYLATAYKENARFSDSVVAFLECLKHSYWNEERWHARINAGNCLAGLGRFAEARDQYSMALDEQPERAEAYYHLGDLAYKQQRFREALAWFERCCAMPMPTSTRLFLNPMIYMVTRYDALAMVYHHLHDYRKAIESSQLALAAVPNDKRILANIEAWSSYLKEDK